MNGDHKIKLNVSPMYGAYSKNTLGISFNYNICYGPKIQKNISHPNNHMRLAPVVLVSDLEKRIYSVGYQQSPLPHTKFENTGDAFSFLYHHKK